MLLIFHYTIKPKPTKDLFEIIPMPTDYHYFSFINQIKVSKDEASVMNSDAYIEVRDHINRHAFSNDWQTTKTLIEEINQNTGINFMAAVYYTVAITKTDGINGLASGLEITLAAMAQSEKNVTSQKKQDDAINWMLGLVKSDIKTFTLGIEDLRTLYRCERACHVIKVNLYSDQLPNLDTTQRLLSEFIGQFQPSTTSVATLPYQKKTKWLLRGALTLVAVSSAILFYHRELDTSFFDVIEYYYPKPHSTLSDDLSTLSSRYGSHRVDKAQAVFIEHYLKRADDWTRSDENQTLLQIEDWLKQLEQAYGKTTEVSQHLAAIGERKHTLLSNIDNLTQRFITNRTQIANFKQSIVQIKNITKNDLQSIKDKAVEIESYSISLSPFLSRTEYISKHINEGNLDTAEDELRIFKRRVSGLLLKIREFEEKLDEHN